MLQVQKVKEDAKYQDDIILYMDYNLHISFDRRNYELNLGEHIISEKNEADQKILTLAVVKIHNM